MKRPAGHSAQVGASPPTLCWPGPHSPSRTSETHFVRSPDACEPGGQGSQPEAPRLACTVFMGQLVQGSPAASRYVPGAHGACAGGATLVVLRRSAHMAEPAALHWPVGHARQVLVRVALAGWNHPWLHFAHPPSVMGLEYSPLPQELPVLALSSTTEHSSSGRRASMSLLSSQHLHHPKHNAKWRVADR